MPEIDPISERLGTLTASVENLRTETSALSIKLDVLMSNYAKSEDVTRLENRVMHLEHSETTRKANTKTAAYIVSSVGGAIGLAVLFLSGAWHDLFGH